jgi:uncharacterized protein DUF4352
MRRWVPLVALCVLSGCSSTITGEPAPEMVVGVTQTAHFDGDLDVTPAPVYKDSEYASEPDEGTRLVAVQFRVTNAGEEDRLIGPTGTVHFVGGDGKSYDDSLVETSAGAMLDQLRLAPGQTMVGYTTAELPTEVVLTEVTFEASFGTSGDVLTWKTAGQAVTEPPAPPAMSGDGPETQKIGTDVEVAGSSQGEDFSLRIAPGTIVDPADPTGELAQVGVGAGRRLIGVDFTVANTGDTPYSDIDSGADLRSFAVHNAEDEAYTSHVYGASEDHGMPLMPGDTDTWHILFEIPTDFTVDRISFSPSFGSRVATIWVV